ncbi:MAG: hypothetical protein ACOY93_04495 [Bacillota bacterium]
MKRIGLALLTLLALLLAGCAGSGGSPVAAVSETRYDFGNVPMSRDKKDTRTHEFTIRNEGTADLKLGEPQVKLLEGC